MQTPRSFAGTGLAAALCAGELRNLNPRAKGANEKIALALIGGHNQGNGVALRAIERGADIKTICDIDDAVCAKFAGAAVAKQKSRPLAVRDFRRVLDDKAINGVIIAAPEHWHIHMALLACRAGKDAYVEKPLSQTIREGQLIRDAARKYNRVVQVGIHRRSAEHNRGAMEYIASGRPGEESRCGQGTGAQAGKTARISTTLRHLGAAIDFDLKTGTFPGNARANAMLTKEYRKGYELPKV
ncbi:MAG: Gfo/Idh/MocA family protein [Bryobacteraceae bacterium]